MKKSLTVGVIGSHSALDICAGVKAYGFKNLVITEKGRDKTYGHYYFNKNGIGCVDECISVNKFDELLQPSLQKKLKEKNVIFIPHRSFEVYLNFNYEAIENNFPIPIFGNRFLLKIEERGARPNQYDILEKANIRYPTQFKNPNNIDKLCLVKVLEKERKFERAFFLVESYQDYNRQVKKKLKDGIFAKKQIEEAVIEEFIVGVHINFHYFYSPLTKRLELMGTDTRRQTNSEGLTRLPANYQLEALKKMDIKYEEAGHIAVTVLESMLEPALMLGEQFVQTTQKLYPPGIIGPFALQSIIIPGPPKKEIIVVDVSPRMPGSPGISATPYMRYLYGKPMSVGERIGFEISEALKMNKLHTILT